MLTIAYEKVFSRFLAKIKDVRLPGMPSEDVYDWEVELLHLTVADVRFRHLFSSFRADDTGANLLCNLAYSVDDYSDTDFIVDVVSTGMACGWMRPELESIEQIALSLGGKEEKKLVDHYSNAMTRLQYLEEQFHKKIRDHNYLYNDYTEDYV